MSNFHHPNSTSHSAGLQILLKKQTYVFPWSQFLFAEGDSGKIRVAFSTHDVTVTGAKLDKLLEKFADQRIDILKEPLRAETMMPCSGAEIAAIVVAAVEAD
jgi:hypothetical protein